MINILYRVKYFIYIYTFKNKNLIEFFFLHSLVCSQIAGWVAPIQQRYVHSASSENIPDPRR